MSALGAITFLARNIHPAAFIIIPIMNIPIMNGVVFQIVATTMVRFPIFITRKLYNAFTSQHVNEKTSQKLLEEKPAVLIEMSTDEEMSEWTNLTILSC